MTLRRVSRAQTPLLLALAASSSALTLAPTPARVVSLPPLAVRRVARAPLCCEEAAQTADEPPLDVVTVAEMLEASFVRACMDLRTGLVDTLKLFIVAAKAGYELGATFDDVSSELAACPRQTANRPLMEEEVELRSLWVALVYLALAQLSHPTEFAGGAASLVESVPAEIRAKHEPLVSGVVEARTRGAELQSLKLEELLPAAAPQNPQERAILSQSMRLVFLTAVVLDEVERARPRKAEEQEGPPRPYIPGTG